MQFVQKIQKNTIETLTKKWYNGIEKFLSEVKNMNIISINHKITPL
jgi:hypothetical protein